MVATLGLSLLGLFLWQGTAPPDISGKWHGAGWGEVELEQQSPGNYKGEYSDTSGEQPGTVELKWSRIERRFNGTWREGQDRFGDVSLRHTDDGILGAWTTSKKSNNNSGRPSLADLQWTRHPPAVQAEAGDAKATEELVPMDVDANNPGRLILHYCDADGVPIRPLLKDAELRQALDRQGTPDVSADGKKVAFDAWSTVDPRWQSGQIVVCDIDGSNAHVICDGFMPSFSPDGKRMAISRLNKYTKADGVKGNSIWIVNTDGSKKRMVAERGAWGARWSSDGKSLVFLGGVDENDKKVPGTCLRLYDFETEKITNVYSPEESPFKKVGFHFEWAKNKRSVAFAGIKKGAEQYVSATIDVEVGLDSLQLFDSPLVLHWLCYDYHPDGDSLLVTGIDNRRPVPASLALTDEGATQLLAKVPANVMVRDTCYTPDGNHIIAALSGFEPANMPEENNSNDH